jgi:LPS export ABC transporter protein LptC
MIFAFMPRLNWNCRAALVALLCGAALAGAAYAAGDLVPAELSVEGMTYVASDGGRNEVIVEAEKAGILRGEQVARLEGVHARVGSFAAPGSPDGGLELRCERGSFDLEAGDLTAEGTVRGTTADGRRFETERLIYRRATGRVTTEAPVVIRDGFGTLRGAGFEYWVRENRFRLVGGASVVQER